MISNFLPWARNRWLGHAWQNVFLFGLACLISGCGQSLTPAANAVQSQQALATASVKEPASPSEPRGNIEDVPDAPSLGTRGAGVDWPSFLGPSGDGKSPERGLAAWPEKGPRVIWTMETGEGYAAPTVCRGRLLLFERVGNEAICRCVLAETGKPLWSFRYLTNYRDKYNYDGGPRACPVTDGARVYLHGVEGMLHCLRLSDGQSLWKVDTFAAFGVVQNFFGVASAPRLAGDLLLVQVGGSPPGSTEEQFGSLANNGSCIVAFDKTTGAVRYRTGEDLASYASPQLVTLQGKDVALILARQGLHGFDPASGKELFYHPFRSRLLESVNASNLVIRENQLLLSECYAQGSSLVKYQDGKLQQIWSHPPRRRDAGLACHWNTPILLDGFLYGCHGRQPNEAELRCIDWNTGQVKWRVYPEARGEALGRGSLTYADGHFFYVSEDGTLVLFKAQADRYQPIASWTGKPLLSHPCWASPVLSHGLLYLRGQNSLVCVEVIPTK
jgi:outer membrane protein assembly factor BamB